MIILRDKNYSGYQPTFGVGYADSVQIKQGVNGGVYRVADILDKTADYAENSHPIVNKASKKWRNRITGYTKPIKKMLTRKKKQ
jgi:hypothetical protein